MQRRSIFYQILIIVAASNIVLFSFFSFYANTMFSKNTFSLVNDANKHAADQLNSSFDVFYQQLIYIIAQLSSDFALKQHLTEIPEDTFEYYQMQRYVGDYLQTYNGFFSYSDVNIVLRGENGCVYSTYEDRPDEEMASLLNEDFIRETKKSRRKLGIDFSHPGITKSTRDKNYIFVAKPLFSPYSDKIYGTAIIIVNENCFSSLFSDLKQDGNRYSIITGDGLIVSDTDKRLLHTTDTVLLSAAQDSSGELIEYRGKQCIPISAYNRFFGFWIVQTMDYSIISDTVSRSLYQLLGLSSFVLAADIILIILAIRGITNPIRKLNVMMRNITKQGNLQKPDNLSLGGCAEAIQLGDAFIVMFDELELYISNLLAEQEERRAAELNALQTQIHPHFIYNTMACIKYLASSGKNDDVVTGINALTRILRKTLSDVRECIPFEDELSLLEDYFHIQRLRYGSGLRLSIHVGKDCMRILVPKLFLQPIVENAVCHAFPENNPVGSISVYAVQTDSRLGIEVIDTGQGIPPERMDQILGEANPFQDKKLTGIGIQNVDERIKMIYGRDYGIAIVSTVGTGTQVTIRIPAVLALKGEVSDESAN